MTIVSFNSNCRGEDEGLWRLMKYIKLTRPRGCNGEAMLLMLVGMVARYDGEAEKMATVF